VPPCPGYPGEPEDQSAGASSRAIGA
jgi:hypothetical protein